MNIASCTQSSPLPPEPYEGEYRGRITKDPSAEERFSEVRFSLNESSRVSPTEPSPSRAGAARHGGIPLSEYRSRGLELQADQTADQTVSQPQELARMHGVVVGKGDSGATVRIQFAEPDMLVEFPSVLFTDRLARYGQPVDYVVKIRPNGFRFQCFEEREAENNPSLPDLEALLSAIEE